jgi:hypothetical protein
LCDLVTYRPSPSLEGFAALDRLDEALTPSRKFDERVGDKAIRHGDSDVSLYEVMQDGMGVLLDASTQGKLSELVAATTQRIRRVAVDTGPSMLVRPDACIAWVGEANSTNGLEKALRRWFIPSTVGPRNLSH